MPEGTTHVFQCPGCWSTGRGPAGADWECECGEKMTCVDLRAALATPTQPDHPVVPPLEAGRTEAHIRTQAEQAEREQPAAPEHGMANISEAPGPDEKSAISVPEHVEEDWPPFVVQRFEQDDPIRPYRYVVLDGTQSTDFTNCCRYAPADTRALSQEQRERLERIARQVELWVPASSGRVGNHPDAAFLRSLATEGGK